MPDNRYFFEDLARVATGAAEALASSREQVRARMREGLDQMMGRLDVVSREEFDAMAAVASAARTAQETLEARVAALEARIAALEASAAPSPRRPIRRSGASSPSTEGEES